MHQWCHLAISSSDILFSCPQSFPASETFLMSQLCTSDCQTTGASISASVLPMNIQGWFPLILTDLISKGPSGVFSSTTFKGINSLALCLLYSSALTTIYDHWEGHIIDYMDLSEQSNVSAFQHTVCVWHRFPTMKQASSDIMAAVGPQWF